MFRRLSDSLPRDPVFKADLKELGYFVNQDDQLRMIRYPNERYRYKLHRRERINELYKEAFNACIRQEILARLHSLGLRTLRLPLGAAESSPNVPILVSNNLSTAKRVIVYFGERSQDLGIFAYRVVSGDEGINAGSAVDFVKTIRSTSASAPGEEPPAIVIANPGQLIWCRSQGRAVTRAGWETLPRESSVHPGFRLDEETGRNLVDSNRDEAEHVEYVFDNVLSRTGRGKAKIDAVGAEWTGAATVRYLSRNWSKWFRRMNSVSLIAPLHDLEDLLPHSLASKEEDCITNGSAHSTFKHFMSTRCRGYIVHEAPLGTPVEGRADFGCSIYAGGENLYAECIMIRAKEDMLEWATRLIRGDTGAEEEYETPDANADDRKQQDGMGQVDEAWAPDTAR